MTTPMCSPHSSADCGCPVSTCPPRSTAPRRCAARRRPAPTRSCSTSTCRCSTASASSPHCGPWTTTSPSACCRRAVRSTIVSPDSKPGRTTTWSSRSCWQELVARVKALLRRRGSTATFSSETIQVGPLEVDIPGRRARVNGVDVDLTKREFDLLAVLAEHKTAVLSRAQLLELVWGYDFAADTNVVDVFIGYLRRKLEAGGAPRLLHTVRGVGFVLRHAVVPMSHADPDLPPHPVPSAAGGVHQRHRRGDRRRHRGHRGLVRHHRRVERAAGPQARRGGRIRDSVPAARTRRDPEVAQRPGRDHHRAQGRTGDVELGRGAAAARARLRRHLRRRCALPGPHGGHPAARADVGGRRRDLRRHHRRYQQPASQGDHHLHPGDRRRDRRRLGAGRVRRAPLQTPCSTDPSDRRGRRGSRHRRRAAPPKPSRSPRRCRGSSNGSGTSRTRPRPR